MVLLKDKKYHVVYSSSFHGECCLIFRYAVHRQIEIKVSFIFRNPVLLSLLWVLIKCVLKNVHNTFIMTINYLRMARLTQNVLLDVLTSVLGIKWNEILPRCPENSQLPDYKMCLMLLSLLFHVPHAFIFKGAAFHTFVQCRCMRVCWLPVRGICDRTPVTQMLPFQASVNKK